jgi:ribosomal protein S18 acetylase RimI-like enzyme
MRCRNVERNVIIRDLIRADMKAVARVHVQAFPSSALTRLGLEAVKRYYEWLLLGPHDAVRFGAFEDGQAIGFCFGGIFRGALSGFLRANRGFLIFRVILRPWLVTNQIFRDRLLRAVRILRRSSNGRPSPLNGSTPRPFGILSIGVLPSAQGLGVGRLLMQQTEDAARRDGYSEMLLTVSTSNHKAIRFYENLQWKRVGGSGRWEGSMSKPLAIV